MSFKSFRVAFRQGRKMYGKSILVVGFVTYAISHDQYNTWLFKTKIREENERINEKVEALRKQLKDKGSKTTV